MSAQKNKELIVKPLVAKEKLNDFLSKVSNVSLIYSDPAVISNKNFKTIFNSDRADFVVTHTLDALKENKKKLQKSVGYSKMISSNEDLEEIVVASKYGADFVIVEAIDWKIIPLENLIAKLQKTRTKIYTTTKNSDEIRTMFSVLEHGVNGVILETADVNQIENSHKLLDNPNFKLEYAKILELKDVGMGERVCVDTVSMMTIGEGMLIGSKSNFLFLVHNESVGSSFTSPRPFRVNAGAIHCYTPLSDGTTKYLSELEAGVEILVVGKDGSSRKSTVGRSKIESRPMRMVKAELGDSKGSVILQNAETIRLIAKDNDLVSVTNLKIGDEVLVYTKSSSGRHFGMPVDEFILEK
ncbi:MAG TPA: 3-dehydroquinate synthase II [Nitrososphaeraceae archaeon]